MHPKVSEYKHLSMVSPVQLGKTDQVMGTIFKKQIMSYGTWINPNWWWDDELWMELDEGIADQMIANFNANTFGKRISVPRNHTGDVNSNAGEVIKLEKGEGGLWAYLDIRDPDTVQKINNGLVFDVSMGWDPDYQDQKEGKRHGAVLIHVALVTDPYLNDMDDFSQVDTVELSRRYDEWAGGIGFANAKTSLIMMSKDNVEELKRMKFAKVVNDKDHDVEITYKHDDDTDVTQTLKPGEEVEVPTEQAEVVKTQIADSTAPETAEEAETTEETEAAEETTEETTEESTEETAEEATEETAVEADQGKELAKANARIAELESEKLYSKLLSKGKVSPAQKNLFMAFAKATAGVQYAFAADVKSNDNKVLFSKGQKTSALTLLSDILEAGPKVIKLGERGGKPVEGGNKVELTTEQEEKLKKFGVNVDTFKKQLAAGTVTLADIEEK